MAPLRPRDILYHEGWLPGGAAEESTRMFGSLGAPEFLIIGAVIILLFGVGKISGLGKELGSSIKEFRKAVKDEDAEAAKKAQQAPAAPVAPTVQAAQVQQPPAPQAPPPQAQPPAQQPPEKSIF